MTIPVAVLLPAGPGGRPLLATADSLARQARVAVRLVLVQDPDHPRPPLLDGIAARSAAPVIDPLPRPGMALNRAAAAAGGDVLALVPAGIRLSPDALERCLLTLARDPDLPAVAPSIRLVTPDGLGRVDPGPPALDAPALLAGPRCAPPVFVWRRSAWEQAGGFDESLDGLAAYEFCLRLALAGRPLRLAPGAVAFREIGPKRVVPPQEDEAWLAHLRQVLERHVRAVAAHMSPVLVAREVAFGRTRERHRALLERRDADLAELDRLRAETAHHRACIEHYAGRAIDWGELRRTDPVSRDWGYDRGGPVDRRYIEDFLAAHSSDVQGAVLEIQEDDCTRAFGGPRVTASDVLDVDATNPRATLFADLRGASSVAADRFDCIVLTQTVHVVDEADAVLRECHRMLKPGGVLLATFPAASRVCLEYGQEGDFWRMTPAGAARLVERSFAPSHVASDTFGNVLTTTAFLQGVGADELTDAEYAAADPYHPSLTGVRARKADGPRRLAPRGVVLLYHRVDAAPDPHGLALPPVEFERHLRYLRDHAAVLPLEALLSTPPERLPDRPVAVTFDDGYAEDLSTAAPMLRDFGIPATFFLTTRWIDAPGEYWWDLLARVLADGREGGAPLVLDHGEGRIELRTPAERRAAHAGLHRALVHGTLAERDRIAAALDAWIGPGHPAARRPLTAGGARELARMPGVAIGCHTVNHLSLPDQPPDVVRAELEDARAVLAALTGRPVAAAAYPYGAVDRGTAAVVRQSFRWGLTCEPRPVAESFDAARVPRLEAGGMDAAGLAAALDRAFDEHDPGPPGERRLLPV